MKLLRPKHTIYNGCGPLALAAVLGGEQVDYTRWGTFRRGLFDGMSYLDMVVAAELRTRVAVTDWYAAFPRTTRPMMAAILPLDGAGFVTCSRGRHHHALAFNGKLVYDHNTNGRWLWAYDHPWARARVRSLVTIKGTP